MAAEGDGEGDVPMEAAEKGDAAADATEAEESPPAEPEPSPEEQLQKAEAAKEAGNSALKASNADDAVLRYAEGVAISEPFLEKTPSDIGEEVHRRLSAVYLALRLNSAQACIKLERWCDAVEHCDKALAQNADNCKALYRRGIGNLTYGQIAGSASRLDQARMDLTRVVKLEPTNREAREQLETARERLRAVRDAEKERFSAAMKGGLYQEEHRAAERAKLRYEEEKKRREEAGEDEISFEDWLKKDKEAVDAQKKKEKEAKEDKAKEDRRLEEEKAWGDENKRRRDEGQEEITLEDWKALRRAEKPFKKEEVVRTDDLELDEEDKKLLQETSSKGYYHGRLNTVLSNAAPKPQQVAAEEATAEAGQVGSVWNRCGTWEEKNMTSWVKDKLTASLKGATADGVGASTPMASSATVKVTRVKSLTGEASLVCSRGKKKCGYDMQAELSFTISFKDLDGAAAGEEAASTSSFSGYLSLPELADTASAEALRIDARWKNAPTEAYQSAATELVGRLKESVRRQVAAFVEEYGSCNV